MISRQIRTPSGGREAALAVRQLFRREGEYWTIEYAGSVCRLRDGAGLRHLACLLGRPGEKVPATELIAALHGRFASTACAGGGSNPDGAAHAERARVSVTRAIRRALQRLAEHHPGLLEHLETTIRTGAACSYAPDPHRTIAWQS